MSLTLNNVAFKRLVEENLDWLLQQPRSLERDHIEMILRSILRKPDPVAYFDGLMRPTPAICPEPRSSFESTTKPMSSVIKPSRPTLDHEDRYAI